MPEPAAGAGAFARYPSLQDRVVLVTGGASGIGASMVDKQYEFTTTFIPGYPSLMSLSFGIRYWLNKAKDPVQKRLAEPAVKL